MTPTTPSPKPSISRVMLDLETLSVRPGAVIVSIGAVVFTGGQIIREFYERVDVQSCLDVGMTMSWDTIRWWMGQSDEARKELTDPDRIHIQVALTMFGMFLNPIVPNPPEVELWGNGAAFDNVLLSEAYTLCKLPQPWKHWNDRCYRTMVKNLKPTIKMDRLGTHHNALDDAKSQAIHLMRMLPQL